AVCSAAHDAEQVLAIVEIVALEIEEDVARRRRRQTTQAFSLDDLAQLMKRRRSIERLDLQPRLFANAHERIDGAAVRLERNRQRQVAEFRERTSSVGLELAALRTRDACDE